ncbi:MAG: Nif3-like dinuclear metal center hexameric protein [Flavobacteriales bacterium]|nr:Nif3-like dinuclear metal center hexameric protein [Flavobacteriales bacterium]
MTIRDIIGAIEEVAPPGLQESYDNAGLIVGNPNAEAKGALLTLDATEEIVDEAIQKGCNLIIAHHPIVFRGLKRITGRNYVERTIIKAIKNDVSIYACHTNLDNVVWGVNAKIGEKIGLLNTKVLSPKPNTLSKLFTFVPKTAVDKVRTAIFENGAGKIGNYDSCSFNIDGQGTFRAQEGSNPHVGNINELHFEDEVKVEAVFPTVYLSKVVAALKSAHPYEEVAYDIVELQNSNKDFGAGLIGELKDEMPIKSFLNHLKQSMKLNCIRFTHGPEKIKKVAVCGGSGSFLLGQARRQGAQAFITADFKYHEFFDAEDQIAICDIGHYESEQFTSEVFSSILTKKFPNFALRNSEINTNPINYFF